VLADTPGLAEDCVDALALDFDPLPPIPNRIAAATAAPLFPGTATNAAAHYTAGRGDPAAAFAHAPYTRREHFSVQRHTAAPMETRGLLATWDGTLRVWGASKVPFFNRRTLAAMMDLPQHAIELHEIDVGGGFGVRGEFYPEDFLIPFAARHTGRPVKWIEDRREHLMATNHSREVECSLEIACDSDGTILGLRGEVWADMGAYIRTNGGVVPSKAAQFLPGPYRIADVGVVVWAMLTNKTPTGTYRGPGRFEANFFRERLFDMAAADLGIDPVAFRRRNLLTSAELPYAIGNLVPYEAESHYDTGDYHETLDRCLAEIRWNERAALQGTQLGHRYVGTGLACFVESGGAGPRENARIVLEPDGTAMVYVGSSALGQGIETALSQVAADALEMPLERIRLLHGSTTYVSEGWGTYHSRAIVMGGSAIQDAGTSLLAAIRNAAAPTLGCTPAEITLDGPLVRGPVASLPLSDLPLTLRTAEGTFASTVRTYSYGAHAAHVAVDPRTGHVEVLDYVAVEDIGRAVNPAIVHGQAIGALVQGLGGVFLDHLVYDDQAQLLTGSLADYLLPTATDFPNIRAITLQNHPSPSNPLGAKGAGEGGLVAVAATIGNAVAAALRPLGVQPNHLPLSPRLLWHAIEAARCQ
jgi:carbon-monoxide dehydrogenase large subunit